MPRWRLARSLSGGRPFGQWQRPVGGQRRNPLSSRASMSRRKSCAGYFELFSLGGGDFQCDRRRVKGDGEVSRFGPFPSFFGAAGGRGLFGLRILGSRRGVGGSL